MQVPLGSAIALSSSGTSTEVSPYVDMSGFNAVQISTTIINLTATNVSFQLQESNDLENWSNKGAANTAPLGFELQTAITDIAAAYVRVEYTLTGTGVAIFSCALNQSNQT